MHKRKSNYSVLYLETVTYAPTVKFIPDEKRTLYILREIITTKEKIYKYIKSYYIEYTYICTHERYTREIYIYIYRIDFV